MNPLLNKLRYHVTGAIERGEGEAIVEKRAPQYTPTPWELDGAVILKGTVCIASCRMDEDSISPKEEEQIAAFIVRACNSHEALIAALKEIARTDRTIKTSAADLADIARAAIAQAGENR